MQRKLSFRFALDVNATDGSGASPLMLAALAGNVVVIKKLVEKGVDPDKIEDAYALSYDMERRLAFQAWVQGYVDMSISSTINMPAWGTTANNESTLDLYADLLIKYLPKLRGITVYPDGARGGQPLVPCTYAEAAGKEGVVFEESEERCVGGACGT